MPRPSCLPLALLLTLTAPSADGQVTFVDVTDPAGVAFHYTHGGTGRKHFIETMGPGCAFLDYDGDGRLDIYAVNGHALDGSEPAETNELYRNLGDGTFREIAREAGADDRGYGVGVTAADYDNDGDADLYITNYGPNVLLRGRGDGTFADHTARAGVGDSLWGTGCAFLDYDNDGLLDLYVANYVEYSLDAEGQDRTPYFVAAPGQEPAADLRAYPSPENFPGSPDVLYRNADDGTFADVTAAAGVHNPAGKGMGIAASDYDGDGDMDVFVANDQTANFLYQNNGDGTFTDMALLAGVGYSGDGRPEASMGADFGDYDNDGLLDLVVPNFHREPTSLYRNEGGRTVLLGVDAVGHRPAVPRLRRLGDRLSRLRQRRLPRRLRRQRPTPSTTSSSSTPPPRTRSPTSFSATPGPAASRTSPAPRGRP